MKFVRINMLTTKLIPGSKKTKANILLDKEFFSLKNNRKKTKTNNRDEKILISSMAISKV